MSLEELRYPIGRFQMPKSITKELLLSWMTDIECFPQRLRKEVVGLTDAQLDTPYRQDGWTVRQVVHHCADSHMNAFVRLKLTLTEDKPTIKPYVEARWAELPDSKMPIEPSLIIVDGLHQRWSVLLSNLSDKDLARTYIHPESGREVRLDITMAIYAWHCNHHLAHITRLKERGWGV